MQWQCSVPNEIRNISRRRPRSSDYAEPGRGQGLNLLFGGVLVALLLAAKLKAKLELTHAKQWFVSFVWPILNQVCLDLRLSSLHPFCGGLLKLIFTTSLCFSQSLSLFDVRTLAIMKMYRLVYHTLWSLTWFLSVLSFALVIRIYKFIY